MPLSTAGRLIFAPLLLSASVARAGNTGIVVEGLGRDLRPEQVPVTPGDVITGWVRGGVQGVIASPFDLASVATEQLPRGPVVFQVERAGQAITVTVPVSAWPLEIDMRPTFDADDLRAYEEGRTLAEEKKTEDGVRAWRGMLGRAGRKDRIEACWLLARMGRAWGQARRQAEFEAAYSEAIGCTRELQPGAVVVLQGQQATQAVENGWLDVAEKALLDEPPVALGPLAR